MQSNQKISLEVIAPPRAWEIHDVQQRATTIAGMLGTLDISCLNLPEVVEETRPGKRPIPFSPKSDHVRFGELIRAKRPDVSLIPHKRSVRLTKNQFAHWVQKIHDSRIRQIVVVGEASHTINYPGLSVPEAAAFIKRSFPGMTAGGITIFDRKDEVERIITKTKSGITFFLSQIIFETSPMKRVLSQVQKRCEEERLQFPDVVVSLAPAARMRDLEFMQWLGVQLPQPLLSLPATKEETAVEAQTFEVLKPLIDDVIDFSATISTEVGFNIGHVVYDNLGLSEKLVELVKQRVGL